MFVFKTLFPQLAAVEHKKRKTTFVFRGRIFYLWELCMTATDIGLNAKRMLLIWSQGRLA